MANENQIERFKVDVEVSADHLVPTAANVGFLTLLPTGIVVFDFGFMKPSDLVELSNKPPSEEAIKITAPGVSRVVMGRNEAEQFMRNALNLLEKNPSFPPQTGESNE